jgi:formylglycine-generating enzyme required for sulfatase activity
MRRLLALAVLLVALPAGAVTIDWVYVGDPGNAPDSATNCYSANCGAVPYAYYISKYEVTNAQYAEFLNATATSDPLGLYNASMGSDATFGGITRTGDPGSYLYTVKPGFESKPVTYVSWYDALRFSNWLNNGQGSGDTETGAYTLLGGTAVPSNGASITRNLGAITFLTSENEWYKAAYYSPGGSYFEYPTGTDTRATCVAPGADTGNSANCYPYANPPGSLTDVGAYALSDSPYGTFDQGGNVDEWNEQLIGPYPGVRGGSWAFSADNLAASNPAYYFSTYEFPWVGFRVASLVPEPGTGWLVTTGLLGLAARRNRRA